MYELLQRVCNTLSSFSSFFWPRNEDRIPSKRLREIVDITEDDDDDDVIIVASSKKLKLHNRTVKGGTRCLMKNTITQTEDMAKKRSAKEGGPWRYELSTKENWRAPVEVIDLVEETPNKFKNQYRPPQHVRSPHRIRRKSFNNKQKIDLPNEINNPAGDGSISKNLGEDSKRPQRKSWPSNTTSLTMAYQNSEFNQEEALKRLQRGNCSQDEVSIIQHDEYSKLLNSFIFKDPQPVVVSTTPAVNIDLTNDSGDELPSSSGKRNETHLKFFEDTSKNQMGGSSCNLSSLGSTTSRRRVKPKLAGVEINKYRVKQIIPIDDEDESDNSVQFIKTPPVARVNSLENRIKAQSPVTDEKWTSEFIRKYEEKKSEMEEMTKMLAMELKIASERHRSNFNDLTVKLLTRHLELTESILDEEEPAEPALPELTSEMLDVVCKASRKHPPDEVLIEKFNYSIKRSDIHTLTGLNWLNDEIINFYTTLIVERSKERSSLPKTYSFSTFFYLRLASSGYQGVKRWTKKVDIFAHNLIVIPVHLKMHWCLAAIDCANKTINYYDSMGTTNDQCLKRLEDYLIEEYKDKKGQIISMDNWTKNNVKDIPRQMNGSDCGVFSCTFAEFLSRQAKFSFEQKDMPYIRQKMIYEIVTGKLLT